MKFLIVVCVLITSFSVVAQKVNTEKYYKCYDRIGGKWKYGTGPYACNVEPFQNNDQVKNSFQDFIFDLNKDESEERTRYMAALTQYIEKIVEEQMARSLPNASSSEKEAFLHAYFALNNQESFFTHYRAKSLSKIKMMRGDFGHGHGIAQVDDRWHRSDVDRGIGANLYKNLTYGLGQFIGHWKRAAKKSCVNNFEDQARSAYGIYNGGGDCGCRFKKIYGPACSKNYDRNDVNYYAKYTGQGWKRYQKEYFSKDDLLKILSCHAKDCDSLTFNPGKNPSKNPQKAPDKKLESIFQIGKNIELLKNINFRRQPGGALIKTLKKGSVYKLLDIEYSLSDEQYFLVESEEVKAWIYTGKISEQENSTWVKVTTKTEKEIVPKPPVNNDEVSQPPIDPTPKQPSIKKWIVAYPKVSDEVKVVFPSGLPLRDQYYPFGKVTAIVPYGAELYVKKVFSSNGAIFVSVSYAGKSGLLYIGTASSLRNFIRVLD